MSMASYSVPVNRTLVGAIAGLLLIAAVVLRFVRPEDQFLLAACVRVGLLMGAIWWALPTPTREAAWAHLSPATFVGLLLAIFTVVRFPRTMVPLLIFVAIIGWLLRRRRPKRTSR